MTYERNRVTDRRDTKKNSDRTRAAHSQTVTVRPAFDPETFARDTDSAARVSEAAGPATLAPTVPPPPGLPSYPLDVQAPPSDANPRESGPPPELELALAPEFDPMSEETIPALAVTPGELDWFELPPLSHHLIPFVNGSDSIATICARSGTKLADALAALSDLARDGFVIASSGTRG